MVHSAHIHCTIELLHLKARQGLRVCNIYVLNFIIVILYCILLCMSSEDPFCMYIYIVFPDVQREMVCWCLRSHQ